jgi:DNA-binding CsgD family transcriptional regulator
MSNNELRLDYHDLVAGQLVIVIQGLPTPKHEASGASAGDLSGDPPSDQTRGRSNGAPKCPLFEEVESINKAIGSAPALFTPLLLASWRGKETLVLELTPALIEEANAEDAGRAAALTEYAKAVLYNGLGRYEHAVLAAQRGCAQEDLGLHSWACLELVEAGARGEGHAVATDSLRHLEEQTRADGADLWRGVWARSAALLNGGRAAEALYREAIERFDRAGVVGHLSRAQLVYGEWLRRENRRVDAREQLRAAHRTFCDIAAEAFAERARRELLATGETARKRTDDTRGILTPQEAQIARLAREGLSNPEIGTELFISPRTVQYHLRKVFRKLDITSRNQLGRMPPSRLSSEQSPVSVGEASHAEARFELIRDD